MDMAESYRPASSADQAQPTLLDQVYLLSREGSGHRIAAVTGTGPITAVYGKVAFAPRAAAWARLRDYHRRAIGQDGPFETATANELSPTDAFVAYSNAAVLALAQLAVAGAGTQVAILNSLSEFAAAAGSLDGLESAYLTGIRAAQIAGDAGAVSLAASVLQGVGFPGQLGGGAETTVIFDAATDRMSLVGLDEIRDGFGTWAKQLLGGSRRGGIDGRTAATLAGQTQFGTGLGREDLDGGGMFTGFGDLFAGGLSGMSTGTELLAGNAGNVVRGGATGASFGGGLGATIGGIYGGVQGAMGGIAVTCLTGQAEAIPVLAAAGAAGGAGAGAALGAAGGFLVGAAYGLVKDTPPPQGPTDAIGFGPFTTPNPSAPTNAVGFGPVTHPPTSDAVGIGPFTHPPAGGDGPPSGGGDSAKCWDPDMSTGLPGIGGTGPGGLNWQGTLIPEGSGIGALTTYIGGDSFQFVNMPRLNDNGTLGAAGFLTGLGFVTQPAGDLRAGPSSRTPGVSLSGSTTIPGSTVDSPDPVIEAIKASLDILGTVVKQRGGG